MRFTARLIALRTASWLVGHLFRLGMNAFVLPGASQKWWWAGSFATKSFCSPGMKFPVQSIWSENSADRAPVLDVYTGK